MSISFASLDLVPAATLPRTAGIGDALRLTDDRYGALLVLTDEDNRFFGIVTPGDLRKAILNGRSLTESLEKVANTSPVVLLKSDFDHPERLETAIDGLKRRYNLENMLHAHAPVVDEEGRILGLISVQALTNLVSDVALPVSHRSVLIIGGAGYIGSILTRLLLDDGWTVRVVDSLLYGSASLKGLADNPRFEFRQANVMNIDALVEAVENVDAVVYLAELVGDPACSLAPQTALKTNYLSVTAAAHLCAYLNINRFVYTSSCSVYGASSDPEVFLTETSPTAPVSLYGKIKIMVEEAVLSMTRSPNKVFSPTILRLGTVFGLSYRPRFDLVVNTFTKDAAVKGRIEVFGGNQWRPQVHVRDVARAIVHVLDAPLERVRAQIFNVGSTDQNHTISDLGDFAAATFPGLDVERKQAMVDPRNYRVNCDKISNALNYKTTMSVQDGMQEMKEAIASGRLGDPDSPEYSNLRTLQGMDFL
jgi:nucleoside-diphosphate-sugar epimerase